MEATRCTGHCCKAFTLPYSPQEITDWTDNVVDGEQVRDMVIYLGYHVEYPGAPSRPKGEASHFYTCKHHDTESGDCKIYATRPKMCSEYPYGQRCNYKECAATHADVLVTDLVRLRRPAEAYAAVVKELQNAIIGC